MTIQKPINPRFIDRTGHRYGRLTVEAYAGKLGRKHYYQCTCACGRAAVAEASNLGNGHTTSCGCLRGENLSVLRRSPKFRAKLVERAVKIGRDCKTHGMTDTPTFRSWTAMLARCTNPNATSYENYGGRGITVCDRWRNSFVAFFEDLGERPDGTTLDRINNDGIYEPSNVRWADWKTQANNRRPARQKKAA